MTTPTWASELISTVCSDYHRAIPTQVNWRNSKVHRYTTGRTWSPGKNRLYLTRRLKNGRCKYVRSTGKITITAGSDFADQKLVLLHELSHHICGARKEAYHNTKFWNLAFELYDRYGVDLTYAYERERDYKVGAGIAYHKRIAQA